MPRTRGSPATANHQRRSDPPNLGCPGPMSPRFPLSFGAVERLGRLIMAAGLPADWLEPHGRVKEEPDPVPDLETCDISPPCRRSSAKKRLLRGVAAGSRPVAESQAPASWVLQKSYNNGRDRQPSSPRSGQKRSTNCRSAAKPVRRWSSPSLTTNVVLQRTGLNRRAGWSAHPLRHSTDSPPTGDITNTTRLTDHHHAIKIGVDGPADLPCNPAPRLRPVHSAQGRSRVMTPEDG